MMQKSLQERIRKEIEALSKEGGELWVSSTKSKSEKKDSAAHFLSFSAAYQHWYTRAIRVIATLAPDRLKEFTAYYEVDPKRKGVNITTYRIQDFLAGLAPVKNPLTGEIPYDHTGVAEIAIYSQLVILRAVTSRLDDVLNDLESRMGMSRFPLKVDGEVGCSFTR